eukprot:222571-Pyramimonas_sp.AAC.1
MPSCEKPPATLVGPALCLLGLGLVRGPSAVGKEPRPQRLRLFAPAPHRVCCNVCLHEGREA